MAGRELLHPIQVRRAFEQGDAVLGSVLGVEHDVVSILVPRSETLLNVQVCEPEHLRRVLGRQDLTRTADGILVLCSPSYRVLAVATGWMRLS